MFDWKDIFKKRIDPKEIPVLEDIVDARKSQSESIEDYPHLFSSNNESTNEDDGVVINLDDEITNDDNNEYENNVVILSSVISQTDVDIEVAEIDESDIDNSDINDSDIETAERDTAQANMIEVDNAKDDPEAESIDETTEKNATEVNKTKTDDSHADDSDIDHGERSDNHLDLSDPEQFEIIVNKVVEQLKPELEQQLHAFVKKALAEKSPEEFLNSLKLDDASTSDKN